MMNFDTGVFPSVLDKIEEDVHINRNQLAFMGNLPYLGICFATIFIPIINSKFRIKLLLLFSVLVNITFCVVITFTYDYNWLCIGRWM